MSPRHLLRRQGIRDDLQSLNWAAAYILPIFLAIAASCFSYCLLPTKRERAGFSSGPENKIFFSETRRCRLTAHYTHGNCILRLTNAVTLPDARNPDSHQYGGQGRNCGSTGLSVQWQLQPFCRDFQRG